MRLLHAADLHIDSPLRGLSRLEDDDLAEQLRAATRQATRNLVELATTQRVDAVLLAGDIYDGDWRDYATGAFFIQQMSQLVDAGMRVFLVSGNHDAASSITRTLRLPTGVTALPRDAPGTSFVDDLGLAVHGQGFARRDVTENLAAAYPRRVPGLVNVGLLHTAVTGRPGHDTYAPCSVADLTALGYEYMALGHVHTRETLARGATTVAFPGNLQGRHPRETGPKGALLVEVEPGQPARLEFHALDAARWAHLTLDVSVPQSLEEVLDAIDTALADEVDQSEGRPVVTRITLTGRTPAAAELVDTDRIETEIRLLAERRRAAVERVRVQVTEPMAADPADEGLRAGVLATAQEWGADPGRLRTELAALRRELGADVTEQLDLGDPGTLRELLDEAARMLDARLAGGGAA
ncbi:MAG: metallophosphoesterase family protein [Actinomycetes bacterium]